MKTNTFIYNLLLLIVPILLSFSSIDTQKKKVDVNWGKIVMVSKTIPTLQVVVNPMLRRNSPIHKGAFGALENLGEDYVRFVSWYPYPHVAVAELQPQSQAFNKTIFNQRKK